MFSFSFPTLPPVPEKLRLSHSQLEVFSPVIEFLEIGHLSYLAFWFLTFDLSNENLDTPLADQRKVGVDELLGVYPRRSRRIIYDNFDLPPFSIYEFW